jgi:hypothetical protein
LFPFFSLFQQIHLLCHLSFIKKISVFQDYPFFIFLFCNRVCVFSYLLAVKFHFFLHLRSLWFVLGCEIFRSVVAILVFWIGLSSFSVILHILVPLYLIKYVWCGNGILLCGFGFCFYVRLGWGWLI